MQHQKGDLPISLQIVQMLEINVGHALRRILWQISVDNQAEPYRQPIADMIYEMR